MSGEVLDFCKIDVNLDTNPKVRRAGRDGRDVFEFVVRRNSLMAREGSIPLKYIEPWYLADVLMMSEDDASNGVKRAVTATLLEVDEAAGVVRIVGWTPEWGRRPLSGAERTERHRLKKATENAPKSNEHTPDVTDQRYMKREVTDVTDQRRGDEIREEEIRSEKNSARPPAGGSGSDSPGLAELKAKVDLAAPLPQQRKPKPSTPTPTELAAVAVVLERLSKQTGVRYSGAAEHTKLIVARLRDGCTELDLRKVIGYCAHTTGLGWAEKPEMLPYLRPETLFGPKTIAKYLDPARAWFSKQFPEEGSR